jgi:dihydrodipicolinate synthase/N-acetylneuraminate lyase
MSKLMNPAVEKLLKKGTVIPAHPLALDAGLKMDEERQRRLTRYYIAAGAGGVAVGVHTTQFSIRKPEFNLLEPVLRIASEEIDKSSLTRPFIKVAGICGPTDQALKEAALAVKYGYHLGLLSMGGLDKYSEIELISHASLVAEIIPVFGFYLQPAVGGRLLSYSFWRAFAEIPNMKAIKVAAFNRYQTLDVVRAVCHSSRNNEITLYTGNDDNIIADLLTPYQFNISGKTIEKRFAGGLLGQWSVGTRSAVVLLDEIKKCLSDQYAGVENLLIRNISVTDLNAAIFDVQNNFKGSIAGIHEILRRQGLLENIYCLDPEEKLSAGQPGEIDRVYKAYPSLTDEDFVKNFIYTERVES